MPVTPKTCKRRSKPYSKPNTSISSAMDGASDPSTDSDSKAELTPSQVKGKSNRAQTANGKSWDGSELNALFDFAMTREGRSWEEAVPGRTANQSRQTWAKSVLPSIRKMLDGRGAGTPSKKEKD